MGSRSIVTLMSLAVVTIASPAYAEDAAALNKIVELNRKALMHFERKEFDVAKDTLLEAVVVGKESGLGTHNLIARTYVHLGAVYVDGLKDRTRGVRYLVLAVKLRPDIALTPSLVTPTLTDAFSAAKAEASGEAAPAPKPAPPPPPPKPEPKVEAPKPEPKPEPKAEAPKAEPKPEPKAEAPKAEAPKVEAPKAAPPSAPPAVADASGSADAEAPKPKKKKKRGPEEPDLPANIPEPLYCPNPDEAPPNEKIALRCVIKPGLQVARVLLFYRRPGGEQFTAVPTVRSPKGWYNGVIPGDAVEGKSLQYYFEARDPADKIAGYVGRSDSPNLMIIREGAPIVGKGALAVRMQRDGDDDSDEPEEDPLAGVREEKERAARASDDKRRKPGAIWVALGIGSGYGWHGKMRLEYYNKYEVGQGVSSSGLLHLAPEIGYQLSGGWEGWAVSLQARNQFIQSEGSGELMQGKPATGAHAVLVRAIRYFGEENTQWSLSGSVGGGEGFRLVVPPQSMQTARNDTVKGGPLLGGLGVGLTHHFSPMFSVGGELCGLAGFPTFAVVGDLRVNAAVAF